MYHCPAFRTTTIFQATKQITQNELSRTSDRLDVVAEGVETGSQLDRLQDMMCDEMQGFLLAMPLSADAFGVMLEQGEVSA